MNVVLSHALNANEGGYWYPELRAAVTKRGHSVDTPNLPDSDAPRLDVWRTTLADHVRLAPADQTVLVGHSIGGVNILRQLEQHDAKQHSRYADVVLVATPAHEVGYDLLAEFFEKPFDWAAMRRAARRFHVLAAADDPVLVPDTFEHVALLVRELGATATVLPAGGHFAEDVDATTGPSPAVRLVTDLLGRD